MPAAIPYPHTPGAILPELVEDLLARGMCIRLPVGGVSMAPRLRNGDRVVVAPVDGAQARFGDLVLYRNSGDTLVLHRVVRRWRDDHMQLRLQTRGDACLRLDTSIEPSQILGRVQRIERPGSGCVSLETIAQRMCAVLIGTGKLVISAIYYKVRGL